MKGKNIMSHRNHLYVVSRWDTMLGLNPGDTDQKRYQ